MRHDSQQLVSRRMPQGVIDLFEPVQVDKQNGKLSRLSSHFENALLYQGKQEVSIGQAGQRIVEGHSSDGLTRLLPFKCQHAQVRSRRHQVSVQGIGAAAFSKIERKGRRNPS
ncbi:hypothetical protein D3C87_1526660 [compost metagenome]